MIAAKINRERSNAI